MTTGKTPPPAAPAPVPLAADQALELGRLERFLSGGAGRFALGFVRCGVPALRESLLAELEQRLSGGAGAFERVDLSDTVVEDLHGELEQRGLIAGERPLMVLGLERSIYGPEPEESRFLRVLNLDRDRLRRALSRPLVFWLDPLAEDALRRGAPDLFDYWGGLFDFTGANPAPRSYMDLSDPVLDLAGRSQRPMTPEETIDVNQQIERHQNTLRELGDSDELQTEDDIQRAIESLDRIAQSHVRLGQRETALPYFQQAAALATRGKDPLAQAEIAQHHGAALVELGRRDEAQSQLEAALQGFQDQDHIEGELTTRLHLADLASRGGNNKDAVAYLKEGRLQAEQLIQSVTAAPAAPDQKTPPPRKKMFPATVRTLVRDIAMQVQNQFPSISPHDIEDAARSIIQRLKQDASRLCLVGKYQLAVCSAGFRAGGMGIGTDLADTALRTLDLIDELIDEVSGFVEELTGIVEKNRVPDAASDVARGLVGGATANVRDVMNPDISLVRADATRLRAEILVSLGQLDEAEAGYRPSLDAYKRLGSRLGEARALHGLARVALLKGRRDEARTGLEEALALFRRIDDRQGEGATLASLGALARESGDLDAALGRYGEAWDVLEAGGFRVEMVDVVTDLARIGHERGDRASALGFADHAVNLARTLLDGPRICRALALRAELHAAADDLDAAREDLRGALNLAQKLEDAPLVQRLTLQLESLDHAD